MSKTLERKTIGVLINSFDNDYQRAVWTGISRVASLSGVNVLFFSGGHVGSPYGYDQNRNNIYNHISGKIIDGLLSVSSILSNFIGIEKLGDYLHSTFPGIPLVSIGPTCSGYSSVGIDNSSAFAKLIEHLIVDHGKRRIVFLGGPHSNTESIERRQAFLSVLERHKLVPAEQGMLEGTFTYEHTHHILGSWLDKGLAFDAVVAANDQMAFACYDELLTRGFQVPEAISVVGFDDFPAAEVFDLPLSTIQQPVDQMAATATQLLIDLITGKGQPANQLLPARLVIRQSCGCVSREVSHITQPGLVTNVPEPNPELQEQSLLLTQQFENLLQDRSSIPQFLQAFSWSMRTSSRPGEPVVFWDNWITKLLHRSMHEEWDKRAFMALHQARILIREYAEGRQASLRLRQQVQANIIQLSTSTLAVSFAMDRLFGNLDQHLPILGITTCFLSLFGTGTGTGNSIGNKSSHLIYAMVQGKRQKLPQVGIAFPATDLFPRQMNRTGRNFCYIVESLFHEQDEFGIMVYEFDSSKYALSDALGFQIRSALKAALLVEELELANEQIRLNQEQLILSEKMAVLGGLVAGISHEINTPIGTAFTAASFMEAEVSALSSLAESGSMTRSQLSDSLDNIRESSRLVLLNLQRASGLVNGFQQISVDLSHQEIRQFGLDSYLREIVQSLQPELKKGGHHIAISCPPELQVISYPGVFSQIITNLTMNSLNHGFRNRTGGVVSIALSHGPDNGLVLEFKDNGSGANPESMAHLFEPFYSSLRNQGGSGLGCYVVYNLVTQKLQGTIEAQNSPGQGLGFIIRIPRICLH